MQWDFGTADLANETQDLQERVDTAAFYSVTVTYPESGTFTINASATNTHSETLGATWATQEVILQHPVVEAWMSEITSPVILTQPTNGILAEVEFLVKLADTERLPTNATVYVHYGDGYSMDEAEPLSDSEYGYVWSEGTRSLRGVRVCRAWELGLG